MGHQNNRARIVDKIVLQPGNGFSIQMVGWLIEQQNVRRREQQLAKRNTATLTAREFGYIRIPLWAPQGVHRHFDLAIQIPKVLRINNVLKPRHLFRGFVRIVHGKLIILVKHRTLFSDAIHHISQHVLFRVQLGLLREVPHLCAFSRPGFPSEFLVDASHHPQKR